jgi:hypothetical protein
MYCFIAKKVYVMLVRLPFGSMTYTVLVATRRVVRSSLSKISAILLADRRVQGFAGDTIVSG